MHFLFYDRYAAYARWINEEHNGFTLKSYLRDEMPAYFNKVNDLQMMLLFTLPSFFISVFMPIFSFQFIF